MDIMKKIILLLAVITLGACSSGTAQKVAKTMRGLTGGDQPNSAFLDPTVKELLEYEMRVCLDGNDKDAELRAACIQTAVSKVKAQKGLDEDIDLGGEVIVRQSDEDEVIDGTQEEGDEGDDQ